MYWPSEGQRQDRILGQEGKRIHVRGQQFVNKEMTLWFHLERGLKKIGPPYTPRGGGPSPSSIAGLQPQGH